MGHHGRIDARGAEALLTFGGDHARAAVRERRQHHLLTTQKHIQVTTRFCYVSEGGGVMAWQLTVASPWGVWLRAGQAAVRKHRQDHLRLCVGGAWAFEIPVEICMNGSKTKRAGLCAGKAGTPSLKDRASGHSRKDLWRAGQERSPMFAIAKFHEWPASLGNFNPTVGNPCRGTSLTSSSPPPYNHHRGPGKDLL